MKTDVNQILSDANIRSKIICDTLNLEWEIDLLISAIYAIRPKIDEFATNILCRLSFAQKIAILKDVEFPRKLKSQNAVVRSANTFRELRNIMAHRISGNPPLRRTLYINKEIEHLLTDFPKEYNKELAKTNVRISRLLYSVKTQHIKSKP